MLCLRYSHIIVWLIAVDVALSNIAQSTVTEVDNHLRLKLENDHRTQSSTNFTKVETRRKGKKKFHRSTSSSSKGAKVDVALSNIAQSTVTEVDNHLRLKLENDHRTQSSTNFTKVETRRKGKKKFHRSTSSSSKGAKDSGSGSGESLSGSDSSNSEDSKNNKKKNNPKSTVERHGWRKWHRKCQKCPEDMIKKWRDPSIKWICGAYQRARRSFKSLCMMHYRNCQDGTMFVKINNFRCQNDTEREENPRGDHFFYEYKARLSGESEKTNEETSSSIKGDSSEY